METKAIFLSLVALVTANLEGKSQATTITVHAEQVLHAVTPFLTGACLEDVNHEVYGGIDSQMIFGESFAEPAHQLPLKDFATCGGRWSIQADGSIQAVGSNGSKIVSKMPAFSDGEASVDVWLTEAGGGNGGLILKVRDAGNGSDAFTGYEISVERPGFLVVGRHRQNWEPIRRVPCDVPVNEWINLTVRMTDRNLSVWVNGKLITSFEDADHPLDAGTVGLRIWQHKVRFRNLSIKIGGSQQIIPFTYDAGEGSRDEVSGMWRPIRVGPVTGAFSLQTQNAFSGSQSQQITFTGGMGMIGIENEGLNHQGMNFVKGKSYHGYVYVRADKMTDFTVALASQDGLRLYDEKELKSNGSERWERIDFELKPREADHSGRFAIELKQPGTVSVGYAFLQPGDWGRFKGLPVRKDVAEGLINQGITVLRYGGCMANAAEYHWKNMTGPRAGRPPYDGWWYPQSSNGWGIFDFLNFCEAAGFLAIPDVNCNETPEDMADFIQYVNGPANSQWGRQRVADGHRDPYHLKYLEIGNEEHVDENYFKKFKPIAEAIWARDPEIILVVGDFAYGQPIMDPHHFTGADSGITSLEAQEKILALAGAHQREVWFDVHVNTDGPRPNFGGTFSYIDALDKLAQGTKHHVVIFEYNAGNHSQRRALANAAATIQVQKDGRLPITTSANCLQPDGQNDNGWDQGLLFLNSSQVWLQPPGYVTRMISQNYEPLVVRSDVQDSGDGNLEVSASKSADGRHLTVLVVNDGELRTAKLQVTGFSTSNQAARVETLAAPLEALNTAGNPEIVKPSEAIWNPLSSDSGLSHDFPAHSFTVIRW